jgi:hypothetical protein
LVRSRTSRFQEVCAPEGFADRMCDLRRCHGRRIATTQAAAGSNNAAELRRRMFSKVSQMPLAFDTTLRSFNARAGLLTEL